VDPGGKAISGWILVEKCTQLYNTALKLKISLIISMLNKYSKKR